MIQKEKLSFILGDYPYSFGFCSGKMRANIWSIPRTCILKNISEFDTFPGKYNQVICYTSLINLYPNKLLNYHLYDKFKSYITDTFVILEYSKISGKFLVSVISQVNQEDVILLQYDKFIFIHEENKFDTFNGAVKYIQKICKGYKHRSDRQRNWYMPPFKEELRFLKRSRIYVLQYHHTNNYKAFINFKKLLKII